MRFSDNPTGDVLKAVTGYNFTPELIEIGGRIYTIERLILNREGLDRKDDQMPERVMKEEIPTGPAKGHRISQAMYDIMLDEYYDARGWDQNGVPKPEIIEKMGIPEILGNRGGAVI